MLGAPGSALLAAADDADLEPVPEAFVDRAYRPDGRLVDRREPDAVVTDPVEVAERAVRLATDDEVEAIDGTVVAVHARSLCVHGDTPGAVALATAVRDALAGAGVHLAAFAAMTPQRPSRLLPYGPTAVLAEFGDDVTSATVTHVGGGSSSASTGSTRRSRPRAPCSLPVRERLMRRRRRGRRRSRRRAARSSRHRRDRRPLRR